MSIAAVLPIIPSGALVKPRRDRLTTFVPPRPNSWLMQALIPVNRIVCLHGLPALRRVPLLNRLPGARGLCDIVEIELPRTDQDRLLLAVNPSTTAFVAPNHPEVFTDWMLDKELSARVAPRMASWATHEVVNGMGWLAQRLWLMNNLIAQIPGEGGHAGRSFSVAWALQGNAVLLHPEGGVGWHAHHVGPLHPGVIDMAMEAAQRSAGEPGRSVYVAPIVWRLRFTRDVTRRLEQEMRYVERRLGVAACPGDLADRVHHVYRAMLAREAAALHFASNPFDDYFTAQRRLLNDVCERLRALLRPFSDELPARVDDSVDETRNLLRPTERWLRAGRVGGNDGDEAARLVKAGRRLLRLPPGLYHDPVWTQEQVAENIKRLRFDYCFGGVRDRVHRLVPMPAGPRVAHIRAAEPLDVGAICKGSDDADPQHGTHLLERLRQIMQTSLDALYRELAPLQEGPPLRNPFFA